MVNRHETLTRAHARRELRERKSKSIDLIIITLDLVGARLHSLVASRVLHFVLVVCAFVRAHVGLDVVL